MGCQESKSEDIREQERRNKDVERDMKERKKQLISEIKLLLLGTGESGKSTIAKQMRILHTEGFTEGELLSYKPVIFNNTITCIKVLIAVARRFELTLQADNQEAAARFENITAVDLDSISPTMAQEIRSLWADPAIQTVYERRSEYQLMDSASYCFENVDRFSRADFVPSEEDVLRVRARTTGIIETTFRIKDTNFRMLDVGGQRSERKKWIHCFEDVTAIIYCVALNEYDMKLFEDESVNRMEESLELFEEISNSKWFTKTAIILFLNKEDLFKEKINKVDLSVLFPEYKGGTNYEAAVSYIQEAFIYKNRNPSKKIFCHITCATNTHNVRVVFDAAKEIIISQNLERLGFGNL